MSETQKIKELKSTIEELELKIRNLQDKLEKSRRCAACAACYIRCDNSSKF